MPTIRTGRGVQRGQCRQDGLCRSMGPLWAVLWYRGKSPDRSSQLAASLARHKFNSDLSNAFAVPGEFGEGVLPRRPAIAPSGPRVPSGHAAALVNPRPLSHERRASSPRIRVPSGNPRFSAGFALVLILAHPSRQTAHPISAYSCTNTVPLFRASRVQRRASAAWGRWCCKSIFRKSTHHDHLPQGGRQALSWTRARRPAPNDHHRRPNDRTGSHCLPRPPRPPSPHCRNHPLP